MKTSFQRTALVTGASGGIGRATAERLAAAGYKVFGTSRRPAQDASKGVTMLACDVTDEVSIRALIDAVVGRDGSIDLLVNNAGQTITGGAEESSIAQVQALFDVNLFGAMRMTNAVLPLMRQRRQGRIINISSVMGLVPGPYSAHYSATKHALEAYSESLDHEVRGFNVRVTLVEPAYTQGTFDQTALSPDRPLAVYDLARQQAQVRLKDGIAKAESAKVVADTVLKVAQTSAPRVRYTAGRNARRISALRRFIPRAVFDKSLRKEMGLPD
jgi:short-subunit dehydrogenase